MSSESQRFQPPGTPPDREVAALRVPPHSIEAEQSVLGGLLLDNQAFDRVADLLRDEDFYRYDHRLIWQQIARLIERSHPADVVTVYEALKSVGKADEVGGLPYLNSLAQELAVPRSEVVAAVGLLDEGATVPFIARYRKEATDGLDDTQLRNLDERLTYLRDLEDRRSTILASIDE